MRHDAVYRVEGNSRRRSRLRETLLGGAPWGTNGINLPLTCIEKWHSARFPAASEAT